MIPLRSELLPLVKEHTERRLREEGLDNPRLGSDRVDLKFKEHLKIEVRKKQFSWVIDEPPERGGTDEGPNPLAYFISGAASCFMMQIAMVGISQNMVLDELEVIARAHYTLPIDGEFKEIIYDVRIGTKNGKEEIINLIHKAERLCFVHNTFKGTRVKLTTNVFLNGDQKIM
jgi:uncharacterized OsmC-like protein